MKDGGGASKMSTVVLLAAALLTLERCAPLPHRKQTVVYIQDYTEYCRRNVMPSVFLGNGILSTTYFTMDLTHSDLPYSCDIAVRTEVGTEMILVMYVQDTGAYKLCRSPHDQVEVYEYGAAGLRRSGFWREVPEALLLAPPRREPYYTLHPTVTHPPHNVTGCKNDSTTPGQPPSPSRPTDRGRWGSDDRSDRLVEVVPVVNVSVVVVPGRGPSSDDEVINSLFDENPIPHVKYDTSTVPIAEVMMGDPKKFWPTNELPFSHKYTEPIFTGTTTRFRHTQTTFKAWFSTPPPGPNPWETDDAEEVLLANIPAAAVNEPEESLPKANPRTLKKIRTKSKTTIQLNTSSGTSKVNTDKSVRQSTFPAKASIRVNKAKSIENVTMSLWDQSNYEDDAEASKKAAISSSSTGLETSEAERLPMEDMKMFSALQVTGNLSENKPTTMTPESYLNSSSINDTNILYGMDNDALADNATFSNTKYTINDTISVTSQAVENTTIVPNATATTTSTEPTTADTTTTNTNTTAQDTITTPIITTTPMSTPIITTTSLTTPIITTTPANTSEASTITSPTTTTTPSHTIVLTTTITPKRTPSPTTASTTTTTTMPTNTTTTKTTITTGSATTTGSTSTNGPKTNTTPTTTTPAPLTTQATTTTEVTPQTIKTIQETTATTEKKAATSTTKPTAAATAVELETTTAPTNATARETATTPNITAKQETTEATTTSTTVSSTNKTADVTTETSATQLSDDYEEYDKVSVPAASVREVTVRTEALTERYNFSVSPSTVDLHPELLVGRSWENIVRVAPAMQRLALNQTVINGSSQGRGRRDLQAVSVRRSTPRRPARRRPTPRPDTRPTHHDYDTSLEPHIDNYIPSPRRYMDKYITGNLYRLCNVTEKIQKQVVLINASQIILSINNFTMPRVHFVFTAARIMHDVDHCSAVEVECQVSARRVCVDANTACDGVPNCGAYDIYDEDRRRCGALGPLRNVYVAAATFLAVLLTALYMIHYWLRRCVPRVSEAFFVYSDGTENVLYLDTIMRAPHDDSPSKMNYQAAIFENAVVHGPPKKRGISNIWQLLSFRKRAVAQPKEIEMDIASLQEEKAEHFSFAEMEMKKIGAPTEDACIQTGESLLLDDGAGAGPEPAAAAAEQDEEFDMGDFLMSMEPLHFQRGSRVSRELSLLRQLKQPRESGQRRSSSAGAALRETVVKSTLYDDISEERTSASEASIAAAPLEPDTAAALKEEATAVKRLRFTDTPAMLQRLSSDNSSGSHPPSTAAQDPAHAPAGDDSPPPATSAPEWRFWSGSRAKKTSEKRKAKTLK